MVAHLRYSLQQPATRGALVALGSVLLAGAIARVEMRGPTDASESSSLERLAEAVGEHRLTRARFSGGFAYATCDARDSAAQLVQGLICQETTPESWRTALALRTVALHIRRGGVGESDAGRAHTLGVWSVVWGRPREAAEVLRKMTRERPRDARALNDLAVALSALAQAEDDPTALIEAFTAVDSAVRLDTTFAEARFTQAILLESLQLPTDAIVAWRRYLELDRASRWATEARDRLASLGAVADRWPDELRRLRLAIVASDTGAIRAIVARYPANARPLAQDSLGAWGSALLAGRARDAAAALGFVRAIAGPLHDATGDALLQDEVEVIDRSLEHHRAGSALTLAGGHAKLRSGVELSDSGDVVQSARTLAEAERLLKRGGSQMVGWVHLVRARLLYWKQHPDAALRDLRRLRASTPAKYLVLRSYAAELQGLIYDERTDYVRVVAAYDTAMTEGRTSRDPETVLRVASWLAHNMTVLRGRAAGWRVLYAALRATPMYPSNHRSKHAVYGVAANATTGDAPRLSLLYGEETIRSARALPRPSYLAAAYTWQAQRLAQLREPALAHRALDSALAAATRTSESQGRTLLLSDAALAQGLVTLRESPSSAESALQKVVDDYRATGYERGLATAFLLLAQSRVAAGHVDAGLAAFDSAMSRTEQQRATVLDHDERVAFLDHAREVIDQIVALRADQGDAAGAFELFERNRSRVLLEELEGRQQHPHRRAESSVATLRALQRRLPDSTVVLSYAVLPGETLLWVVGRHRFELHRIRVTASELEALVERLRETIVDSHAGADVAAMSEQLFDLLIAPAVGLPREARLSIIPDRWLHFVPFAALRDRRSGRYLVQDRELSYAPSAALLGDQLDRGATHMSRQSRALVVGNPSFDARVFRLPSLPAAEREARSIAAAYADAALLIGATATSAVIQRATPFVDVFHFAGHAVVRTDAPRMSHLLLASDAHSDGAVFSSEVSRWHLPRKTLVVLSGCGTAQGPLSATEGVSSLARAFFAAGASGVVASLWAIEDEGTPDFFADFHHRLAKGESPAAALRATQVEWITGIHGHEGSAPTWAAFQLFGG